MSADLLDDHPRNKDLINIALRYLSLREYSKKELKQKISKKQNFTEDEYENSFEYLKLKNYLSEERYIRQKANILKNKGHSIHYIVQFLQSEGVYTTTQEIMDLELDSDDDLIKRLIMKKSKGLELNNLCQKKTNSIIRYVCSKGHSYSKVKDAINSLKNLHY